MRFILLYIAILLSCTTLTGQDIIISDPGIKQCFIDNYASLINSDSTLNKSLANNYDQEIICENYQINDISILSEFSKVWNVHLENLNTNNLSYFLQLTNVTNIIIKNSTITALPDLTSLKKLNYLHIINSGITSIPPLNDSIEVVWVSENDIPSINLNKNYPALTELLLDKNNIVSITGLNNAPNLRLLFLGGNALSTLPSLENLDSLERLQLWGNYLSTLKGLNDKPNLYDLNISNNDFTQIPYFNSRTLTYFDINSNLFTFEDILPLLEWEGFPDNSPNYHIQKNQGVAKTITKHEGDYWNIDIPFDQNINNTYFLWYKDNILIDSSSIGSIEISSLSMKDAGTYSAEVKHYQIDSLVIKLNPITLKVLPFNGHDEPIAFSPNGDGYYDMLYIDSPGKTKIYNEYGICIKTLTTPANWDGTTDNSTEVPLGYYIIFTEDKYQFSVTVAK